MRTKTDASSALIHALLMRAAARVRAWRKLFGDSYRPEKHYMRGPGPKWRQKYAHAGAGTTGAKLPTRRRAPSSGPVDTTSR